jgi:hypothetical protein
MSAFPPKIDLLGVNINVRKVPLTELRERRVVARIGTNRDARQSDTALFYSASALTPV